MRHILAVCAVVALLAPVCHGQFTEITFSYPDGSVPEWLFPTGDPDDEGAFEVLGGVLRNVEAGSAHYLSFGYQTDGLSSMTFEAEGTNWIVAWQVALSDPLSGRCVWFSHGERDGSWGFTLSEFAWEVPEGTTFPETAFTWHNGVDLNTWHVPTVGPLSGWHEIEIDFGTTIWVFRISVDRELILGPISVEPFYDPWPSLGLGCQESDACATAFDNIFLQFKSPVQADTWGRIKSMYLPSQ